MKDEKKPAPIIEDGKTLDELLGDSKLARWEAEALRKEGLSDKDIWEHMLLT